MVDGLTLVPQGGGIGTGAAQVLAPPEPIKPSPYLYQKIKDEKAVADKHKENLAKMGTYDPKWELAVTELEADNDALRNLAGEIESKGGMWDDPTTKEGREFLKYQQGFENKKALNADAYTRDKELRAKYQADPTAYDPDAWRAYEEGLAAQKTIADRAAYVRGSNPLVKRVNVFEKMDAYLPETFSNEKNYGLSTELVPEANWLPAAQSYASTPEGQDTIDYYIKMGKAKDDDEVIEKFILPEMKRRKKESQRVNYRTTSGGSGSGGSETVSGLEVAGKTAHPETSQGYADEITFKQKGQDLKPFTLFDEDGNDLFVSPSLVYYDPQGKVRIRGRQYGRVREKVTKNEGDTAASIAFSFGVPTENVVDNEDGTVTIFDELKQVDLPYDVNEANFRAATGFNLQAWQEANRGKHGGGPQAVQPNVVMDYKKAVKAYEQAKKASEIVKEKYDDKGQMTDDYKSALAAEKAAKEKMESLKAAADATKKGGASTGVTDVSNIFGN